MKDRGLLPLRFPGSSSPAILRDAIASARDDVPDAAKLAKLAARLPLGSPPPGGSSPGGGSPNVGAPVAPPVAAAPPSVLSGALIGAALGVLVSGAGLLWSARQAPAPLPISPIAATTASAGTRGATVEALRDPPVTAPLPVLTAPSPASRPAPAVATASASVTARAVEIGPAPAGGGGVTSPDAIDTETEAHLLQRAQDALGASPAQALALTQAHASRFPAGALAQEREVVAIQALLRLGRADDARARGARFIAAFPGSAHRRRIEALLGP